MDNEIKQLKKEIKKIRKKVNSDAELNRILLNLKELETRLELKTKPLLQIIKEAPFIIGVVSLIVVILVTYLYTDDVVNRIINKRVEELSLDKRISEKIDSKIQNRFEEKIEVEVNDKINKQSKELNQKIDDFSKQIEEQMITIKKELSRKQNRLEKKSLIDRLSLEIKNDSFDSYLQLLDLSRKEKDSWLKKYIKFNLDEIYNYYLDYYQPDKSYLTFVVGMGPGKSELGKNVPASLTAGYLSSMTTKNSHKILAIHAIEERPEKEILEVAKSYIENSNSMRAKIAFYGLVNRKYKIAAPWDKPKLWLNKLREVKK